MAGTKLEHAKQSVEIMLEGLDESRDYVNLFVFDNDTRPVVPAGLGNHSQVWPLTQFFSVSFWWKLIDLPGGQKK